ncbi:AarF/ABC1/UbiB kinase family protein, partial [bacterium]
LRLTRYAPVANRIRQTLNYEEELTAPERLRMAFEELGPTFVKLGQLLASRPDIIGDNFAVELSKLREEASPFPFEQVELIIREETGKRWEEIFEKIDETPLAAASVAQVHRAALKDGRKVVIKIQRPSITKLISRDLAVLQLLLAAAEKYIEEAKDLGLHVILDEFSRSIKRELDFMLEASNSQRLRRETADEPDIVIPEVHWEYTTEKMIVFEEVEGVAPTDQKALDALGINRKKTASALARAIMRQVLMDGVFHADLHSGNIRITPEGKIALLDLGAVGYLSEEMRESIGNLLFSILARDYQEMVNEFMKVGYCDGIIDERGFERDLRELTEPYRGRPLEALPIGKILSEGISMSRRYKVRVPPELVMLVRTLLVAEEAVSAINPDTVVLDEALPFAKKLLLRRLDPKRQLKLMKRAAGDYGEMVRKLPSQLSRILQRVIDSRLSIDFVHKGYEQMLSEMDRVTNRLSLSVIIGALIVGSALISHSGRGPLLWDFPVFGIVGFLMAGLMGLWLAIMIL